MRQEYNSLERQRKYISGESTPAGKYTDNEFFSDLSKELQDEYIDIHEKL